MIKPNPCYKLLFLFIILFIALLSSNMAWAQSELNTPSEPLTIPVQIDVNGKTETTAIQIEQSKKISNLADLRKALADEAYHEQIKNHIDGPIKSANKRFIPESFTFFLANGLILTESMIAHGYTDPLAMERHILSLKDPIANLSFYAFMQANGIYMNKKTMGLMETDSEIRARKMRFFSYRGLVWGSLASSLVSDVFMPFKPCLDKLFKKDYRFTKQNEEECKAGLDSSYKQWTVKKKFEQYAPQILSLLASQILSEYQHTFIRLAIKEYVPLKLLLSYAESNANKLILKVSAVDVGLTLLPTGWVLSGVRWVGKLAQITSFMAIDHFVSKPIYRAWNNLWKPMAFDFDALSFNRNWSLADQYNWNIDQAESDKLKCPVQNEKCLSFANFPKEIEKFTLHMQEWRQHLNAENEENLAGWMEYANKILNQIELSNTFYKKFTLSLFEALNIGHRLQNKDDININIQPLFPFRTFPLYGVTFKTNSEFSVEDQHLLSPQHLEKHQLAQIYQTVTKYATEVKALTSVQSKNYLLNTLQMLSSTNLSTVAEGLQSLNKAAGFYGREASEEINNYPQLKTLAQKIRSELGNPDPVLQPAQGLARAFSMFSINLDMARQAKFNWSGKNYSFKNDGDYFMYQILCGPQQGSLTDNLLFSDNFTPPSLLKSTARPFFCDAYGSYITSDSLYKIKIDGKNQILNYIIQNLNYNTLGDYRNNETKNQFNIWWQKNVTEKIKPRFADMDRRYHELVDKTYDRLFSESPLLDKLNQSNYLPRTIYEEFKWEFTVYLNILGSLTKSENSSAININYLRESRDEKLFYFTGNKKIVELQNLYQSYLDLLKEKEMTYEKYSEISQKINTLAEELKSEIAIKNKLQEEVLNKTLAGLAFVEAEIRRFIRMKILLSQTLKLDAQEKTDKISKLKPQKVNSNLGFKPPGK